MSKTNSSTSNINVSTTTIDTSQSGHMTGRTVPLVQTYRHQSPKEDSLHELPSHKLQHTVWHELRNLSVLGSELKAPRIRKGPGIDALATDEDEKDLIHHSLKGGNYRNHRNTIEDWENTLVVNLCYQELNHAYQKQNFHRVLSKVKKAHRINLTDNGLTNISSCTFNSCTILVMDNNYVSSFHNLPRLPNIIHLSVKCNDISSLSGLQRYRKTPMENLAVQGNPVTFTQENFRQRVFQALPGLKVLDKVPRLTSDTEFEHGQSNSGSCVIS